MTMNKDDALNLEMFWSHLKPIMLAAEKFLDKKRRGRRDSRIIRKLHYLKSYLKHNELYFNGSDGVVPVEIFAGVMRIGLVKAIAVAQELEMSSSVIALERLVLNKKISIMGELEFTLTRSMDPNIRDYKFESVVHVTDYRGLEILEKLTGQALLPNFFQSITSNDHKS